MIIAFLTIIKVAKFLSRPIASVKRVLFHSLCLVTQRSDMEGKYTANSKENLVVQKNIYGSINPCCDEDGKDCETTSPRMESSFEAKINAANSAKSCSCTVEVGDCSCGAKKKGVQLEPWSRYKTIAMAVGLSLFGVWIVIIAIIGSKGKL